MELNCVIEQIRCCLLDLIGPLIHDRVVVLTGSVANNDSLEAFFVEAGAREVRQVELFIQKEEPIHRRLSDTEALIANPPPSIRYILDIIDSTSHAIVYAGSFTAQSSFCGREIIGGRQSRHFDAERKDQQLEYIADRICSQRCIIDLTDENAASQTVYAWVRSSPTVVSGIPDSYLAMGSSHTYLIPEKIAIRETYKLSDLIGIVAHDCRKAMLSTLNTGIPCTYYGYVSRHWVTDFGPFEALVYWNRKTWQLWAPGIVRPLLLDDSQYRAASNVVHGAARRLHEKIGYTGAFGVDGVMQADQYLIHEINPRVCAGFSLLAELCGGCLPLMLIDLALRVRLVEADEALRAPLSNLALLLQEQKPLVKLWDAQLRPVQEKLRSQVNGFDSVVVWVAQVRQSLANNNLVPLVVH
jgi:hypothetical protein